MAAHRRVSRRSIVRLCELVGIERRAVRVVDLHRLSRSAAVRADTEGERLESSGLHTAAADIPHGADRIRLQEPEMRRARAVLSVLADGGALQSRGLYRHERHSRLGPLAADAQPEA